MNTTRTLLLTALPLAAALALAGCAPAAQDSMHGMNHGEETGAETPSAETGEFNDADAMFAAMMIPHHQQAVEMSDMVLAKSDVGPAVVDLAEEIKAAQGPEIELMESWLDDWGVAHDEHAGMEHGDGMMSEDDMAALESADGAEAGRLFIEQMILHHEGAVEMAQTELDEGVNPDALELAQAIIDTQTDEIATMKQLLAAP